MRRTNSFGMILHTEDENMVRYIEEALACPDALWGLLYLSLLTHCFLILLRQSIQDCM